MAYVVPTVADFRARFPEIVATDPQIQAVLDESERMVDTSWTEADYAPAILYHAAHLINAGQEIGASAGIQSESFGPISVSYNRGASVSLLSSTSYGQQFEVLRRINRAGLRVLNQNA